MFAHIVHSQTEMSVSTAPANNQQVCVLVTQHFEFGDIVCNLIHFGLTQMNHLIVVFGFGRDSACFVALFKTTDAVHESFSSRSSPVAYACFRITLVRSPVAGHIRGHIRRIDGRIFIQIREFPCGRTVSYESISQQYNRSHVFQGNLACHISGVETVGRRCCSDYRHRAFAVASVKGL